MKNKLHRLGGVSDACPDLSRKSESIFNADSSRKSESSRKTESTSKTDSFRDPRAEVGYPQAEYDRARVVLMHEPQEELSLGTLHPDAALFKGYLAPAKAQQEHRDYQQILRDLGLEVRTVRSILLEGCTDRENHWVECEATRALRQMALGSIRFSSREISREEVERYRLDLINQYTPNDLMRILFLRPEVRFRRTAINTGVVAEYIMRPLMNLFFMRDQMITTARGAVICKMNSPQRKYECDLVEFCLRKLGHRAIHRITGRDAFLEGGDYLPFRDFAMINCGLRTTQPAIDQLLKYDLLGKNELVVVRDRLKSQVQMHLDSYCNVIDEDLMTLCTNRYTAKRGSQDFLSVEIYRRESPAEPYRSVARDVAFLDFLKERGIEVLPISPEDEETFANNYLCIKGREIVMVKGQSPELIRALEARGVKIHFAELTNLTYGYGAAHCMTQVIGRSIRE